VKKKSKKDREKKKGKKREEDGKGAERWIQAVICLSCEGGLFL
jgi:hypothetical protein